MLFFVTSATAYEQSTSCLHNIDLVSLIVEARGKARYSTIPLQQFYPVRFKRNKLVVPIVTTYPLILAEQDRSRKSFLFNYE